MPVAVCSYWNIAGEYNWWLVRVEWVCCVQCRQGQFGYRLTQTQYKWNSGWGCEPYLINISNTLQQHSLARDSQKSSAIFNLVLPSTLSERQHHLCKHAALTRFRSEVSGEKHTELHAWWRARLTAVWDKLFTSWEPARHFLTFVRVLLWVHGFCVNLVPKFPRKYPMTISYKNCFSVALYDVCWNLLTL